MISPGMRVLIGPELLGVELYGGEDPESLMEWCGREVTVRKISMAGDFPVGIEEDHDAWFCMEEIECIIDETEIDESDEPLSIIIGGVE